MTTLTLNKKLLACTLSLALCSAPVFAGQSAEKELQQLQLEKQDNEAIGLGTGAVIGAIVAGPVGAVVTGVAGIIMASRYNAQQETEILVRARKEEKNEYEIALNNYQQKLFEAEQAYQQELLAIQQNNHESAQLQAENLMMSLQFPTGSSDIKPHYNQQIESLAKLLKATPSLNVDLSGYTDLQGSESSNQALSIARVNSVKQALINLDIQPERIHLYAFGENAPVVANNENQVSFYDRRVVIKLQQDPTTNQHTAKN